jgi:hypothetical protein
MNSTKAISLLNIQLDKLATIDKDTYKSWQIQTSSYIKDIFGEKSDEYDFIKNTHFVIGMIDTPYNQQIKQNTPRVQSFLENCIESLEHRGLTKSNPDTQKQKESWTKQYPVIWEVVKAIIILLVGYFFRVITEPKHNQLDNKTNTEQSPNK